MGMAKPVLLKRLRNDISRLDKRITVSNIVTPLEFPLVLHVRVDGVEGYSAPDVILDRHEFSLILGEDFPYERPKVKWESEIFHPNIMPPKEGGLVCVSGIDHWDFNTGLEVFLKDLTDLINNPNPHDPLRSGTCMAAAEWFLNRM